MTKTITVKSTIRAPVEKVWDMWTKPQHITGWCYASDDWEAPRAENDVRTGGRFKTVMAAKDKSARFNFTGTYTHVTPLRTITYTLDDGRKVTIQFEERNGSVHITETFEMEQTNPEALQRDGWQAILNNFKTYVENH